MRIWNYFATQSLASGDRVLISPGSLPWVRSSCPFVPYSKVSANLTSEKIQFPVSLMVWLFCLRIRTLLRSRNSHSWALESAPISSEVLLSSYFTTQPVSLLMAQQLNPILLISLVVQRLRLCASTLGGLRFNTCLGTKIRKACVDILHALQHGQKAEKNLKYVSYSF